MAIQGIVSIAVGYYFLVLFGSKDAAWDFNVEKLWAGPVGFMLLLLVHILWSWATAPRKLYNQQQADILALEGRLAESQVALTDRSNKGQIASDVVSHLENGQRLLNRHLSTEQDWEMWVAQYQQWESAVIATLKSIGPTYPARFTYIGTQRQGDLLGSRDRRHSEARMRLDNLLNNLRDIMAEL